MNDGLTSWKFIQDNLAAMQKAQVEAAMRLMPRAEHFEGALKAAQDIADANTRAWEQWMAMWGVKK